jgi:signal transduction histidine kinase
MALRVRYVLRNMAAIADLRDEPPAGAMPRRRTKAPRQPVPRPPGSAPILPPAQDDEPVSVLIVDDDAILRTLMRSSLESEGYAVIEAEDGLAAYRACQDRVPALVISDIVMPELNGFELCRLLRQRAQTESVPILVVTGLDDHRSVAEAYDAGATDFIVKPLNWLILKYRIRYMLRAARAYADLAIAKERAEAANRSKSTLLANMTHELRTPLNAVIGFSEIMHRQELGPLSERYTEYAKIIGDSGSHLLTIINDLLDLAKTEAQGIGIADEAVSIPDIVSFCTGVVDPMAQGAEIALLMDVEPGLPPFRGDGKKLQQILINLLGNAIKFTPNGGQVSLRASRGPAGGLVFQIQDTGVGIAADKIALALAPFGQIASSETRKNDGAGLGLPLARHLTELHDGTLEIDSAPGTGTTVIVRFPAERFIDGRGRNSDNGGSGTRRRDPVDV